MNILFLTLVKISSLEDGGIFPDLLLKFRQEGHNIYIISPTERRDKLKTHIIEEKNTKILRVKTLNIQKANFIEKGLGILAVENQYFKALKSYFSSVKFDLVLYSTPPITFSKIIQFVKERDKAYSYLLLKDIFPQNAVDMKMIKKDGVLHKMFLKKEKRLYEISNKIGCMSKANVDFIINHYPEVDVTKLEINPNSIIPSKKEITLQAKEYIKIKYKLPLDKKIFVYGGNLGRPQGLDFLLKTIREVKNKDVFYLIVGSGTEFSKIKLFFDTEKPNNAKLLKGLPKKEYDVLLNSCDIGLIFLHRDFTIPNFPGRFLSYLEMGMPVIAATDKNTDLGKVIEQNNCGYWLESGDIEAMKNITTKILSDNKKLEEMKNNAWSLLLKDYNVDRSYNLIMKEFEHV
ncbi:glycosyltransferase family 4 protein [Pseudotenacibaculum sp. MALMAid0570]|uniref:glycosyltransferase family 4 protein n=1 Tax=Pseudotenacibaculum sp. MALMAid0570 TaxID=3143938 RepID=UPI0032E00968